MTQQYGPPPPAAPQYQGPPQPESKPKRPIYKRWWFIALAVIIGLIVVVSVAGGGEETPTATTEPATSEPAAEEPAVEAPAEEAPAEEAPAEEAGAAVGTPVRDGKFEFVVTGFERPGTEVSDESGFLTETAQGEYLVVRVNVTNIGDEAQTLFAEAQYLYDAEGRKYETSSDGLFMAGYNEAFLEEINPGNTISGAPLLYDVPAGFVPVAIELHDSMLSGGVTVNLQ